MAIPYTETACVQRLQEIVSETSILFYRDLSAEVNSEKKSKAKLISYLSDTGLMDAVGNMDEKILENYCRLAALVLLIQQAAEQKLIKIRDHSLQPHLHEAFRKLPEDFRKFLKIFLKVFKKNIKKEALLDVGMILDFPSDIIGNVYNKFSYNAHQQSHGQHFTQTAEADILNAFCIKKDTLSVFDGSCGSGIFLIRAFYFFQYLHPPTSDQKPRLSIIGIDISPYATWLATINFLFRKKNSGDDFPKIITNDFSKRNSKRNKEIKLSDVCVGNPPFIRHEMIKHKDEWRQLIQKQYGIPYISGQSDLYIYFLIHAASWLKEGGRLGWVISASWLDVQFGTGLQQFLLYNFKIIAIMDYQAKRSFDTASVNTILLVIEKCSNEKKREDNLIKFVRLFSDYEKLIGKIESQSRIPLSIQLAKKIEKGITDFSDEYMQVNVIKQQILRGNSTMQGKYYNGYWGATYLRSPAIYHKIISLAHQKMVPLSDMAEVKYGVKTGANDFFYLIDETLKAQGLADKEYKKIFSVQKKKHLRIWDTCGWYFSALNNKHFIIEREFVLPVFKTQKEAGHLDVKINRLKFHVLNCHLPKNILKEKHKKVVDYIDLAENEFQIHERPSVSGRNLWYDLSSIFIKGDFIFPSKIGEKYRLIDNRKAQVVCDKVNYIIRIKEEWKSYADELFLILNSICFRYFIDLFSRQLTGSQTLSDVDVNLLKKTLIPHPEDFRMHCNKINQLVRSIKSREQLPVGKEILQKDKFEIDCVLFKIIGLKEKDVQQLYNEASWYVEKRQMKSDSFKSQ